MPLLFANDEAIASTRYILSLDPHVSKDMIVKVQRPKGAASTTLVYHGSHVGMGVQSQIMDVTCDGGLLTHDPLRDEWVVPAGCKNVTWRVPFDLPGVGDSTIQRSVVSSDDSFRLFSGASSLANLADADPNAILSVPLSGNGFTFPSPRSDGTLALPTLRDPPLFILIGSRPAAVSRTPNITVRYFVDDFSQKTYVAPLQTETRGLAWLASEMPGTRHIDFNYAWIGVSADAVSMGGATGTELMLVNFVRGGTSDPIRTAVTALAPLIEGTHHLAQPFGSRNGWAEESLATYFGLQALERADPQDGSAFLLMKKLVADSARFPLGLLEAQYRVSVGDKTAYPTYFTKGVVFWSAVDIAMKRRSSGGLTSKSKTLWTMRFQPNGQPPANFASALGLTEEQWLDLRHRFLD